VFCSGPAKALAIGTSGKEGSALAFQARAIRRNWAVLLTLARTRDDTLAWGGDAFGFGVLCHVEDGRLGDERPDFLLAGSVALIQSGHRPLDVGKAESRRGR